jgi:hypothetical protein
MYGIRLEIRYRRNTFDMRFDMLRNILTKID